MNSRVNKLAAALLVVCLSIGAPSAYAAERGEGRSAGFFDRVQQIVRTIKKAVIKVVVTEDEVIPIPNPEIRPRPPIP